jgi:hypothetical protein
MNLIFLITRCCIHLSNRFSSKQFQAQLLNQCIFLSRLNPEVVIYDYYFYIRDLLRTDLCGVQKACFVLYDCNSFHFLKIFLPIVRIRLQIEHTLVKPGGRGAENAFLGNLMIPNSEQQYLVRIADFEGLKKSSIVFDYSRINLYNIRSNQALHVFLRKVFCINPALYPISTDVDGREGIITLFGNPEDSRRKLFLEDLSRHQIRYNNIRGIYFGIDSIYRSVKIVINIRQTEYHDTLEELRVLPALRSGAIVVCEAAPYAVKTWYSKFIIWGSIDQLPKLIADTKKNYNQIHSKIFGISEDHSPFIRRMKRIERCNQLTMLRAVKKVNRDLDVH